MSEYEIRKWCFKKAWEMRHDLHDSCNTEIIIKRAVEIEAYISGDDKIEPLTKEDIKNRPDVVRVYARAYADFIATLSDAERAALGLSH